MWRTIARPSPRPPYRRPIDVSLAEAIEHEREELRSNALAGIADGDPRRRAGALESDIDAAARRRELDGVVRRFQTTC